jgi:tetratricopeptide (TPR) repeat protein
VIRAAIAAFAILLALGATTARADDADRRFRDALAQRDMAALEALGGERPLTRWSDDAWVEAARIAVRGNDFARARRDLEAALAIAPELEKLAIGDAALARRARGELARLGAVAGPAGQWDAVAAEHERLVPHLRASGDPHDTLAALEKLANASAGYPRAAMLMITIAGAWEREGDRDRAIHWLREALRVAKSPADRLRAHSELVRTLTRIGELSEADAELALLKRSASAAHVAVLRKELDRAEVRRTIRWGMRGVLGLLTALALYMLRGAAGSWRGALRRLVRPPNEAIFIVPLAIILIVVAYTGNPLVARAVRTIALAGVATSWISGAILEGREPVGFSRALLHAGLAIVAIVAATYLAVDDGHLINFVIETWRAGHEPG